MVTNHLILLVHLVFQVALYVVVTRGHNLRTEKFEEVPEEFRALPRRTLFVPRRSGTSAANYFGILALEVKSLAIFENLTKIWFY